MPNFNFEMTLPADSQKLFELATDYENFQQIFPDQLNEVGIVSKNNSEIITKEVLTFQTHIKNVKLLTATDISANYISVVDLSANLISVNNLDIHTQIDMNNNYIVNSKFSSIDLQNANSSSGGVLSSFLNPSTFYLFFYFEPDQTHCHHLRF